MRLSTQSKVPRVTFTLQWVHAPAIGLTGRALVTRIPPTMTLRTSLRRPSSQ